MTLPLILGSASPRREKLLRRLGVAFEVVIPEVTEVLLEHDGVQTVIENALRKHAWCQTRFPERAIITADTIVVFAGRCVTKPRSHEEAFQFLRAFSGQWQKVHTAVAMSRPGQSPETEVVTSDVEFKCLTDEEIAIYLDRINPLDKAGGYDIDEYGSWVVNSYRGSWTNIMGLPVETVARWLGIELTGETGHGNG
ncbi:MAG: Maf family protein [Kiritimatiellae bacterium]|nr:Maf family protein [Kiritimatiellia bacterium]